MLHRQSIYNILCFLWYIIYNILYYKVSHHLHQIQKTPVFGRFFLCFIFQIAQNVTNFCY